MSSVAYSAGGHPRLGSRLVRAALMAAGVALLVAALALNAFAYFTLRSGLVESSIVETRLAADQMGAVLAAGDRDAAHRALATLRASPMLLSATLLDRSGQAIANHVTSHRAKLAGAAAALGAPLSGVEFAGSQLRVAEPVRHGGLERWADRPGHQPE